MESDNITNFISNILTYAWIGIFVIMMVYWLALSILRIRKKNIVRNNVKFTLAISNKFNTLLTLQGEIDSKHLEIEVSKYPAVVEYIEHHRLYIGDTLVLKTIGCSEDTLKIQNINETIRENKKVKVYEVKVDEVGLDNIPAYKDLSSRLSDCYDEDLESSYLMYEYNNTFWYAKE